MKIDLAPSHMTLILVNRVSHGCFSKLPALKSSWCQAQEPLLCPPAPQHRSKQEVTAGEFTSPREDSQPAALGLQKWAKSLQEGMEKSEAPQNGLPTHQDGGRAALQTPGGVVCITQSGLHVLVVWMPSAAHRLSLSPTFHPKVCIPKAPPLLGPAYHSHS